MIGEMMETETNHQLDLKDLKRLTAEEVEEVEEDQVEAPRAALSVNKKDTWLENALTLKMRDLTEEVEVNASNVIKKVTLQESVLMHLKAVAEEAEAAEEEVEEELKEVEEPALNAKRKATLPKNAQMILLKEKVDHLRDREEMMAEVLKDGKMKETMQVEVKEMIKMTNNGVVEVEIPPIGTMQLRIEEMIMSHQAGAIDDV